MKKYTKEDIIKLLTNNQSKNTIKINASIDEIIGELDFEEEPLNISNFLLNINHSAFKKLIIKKFDFIHLFNVSTITELTNNIINSSNNWDKYYKEIQDPLEGSNKMKGDLFEIFAEIFFKLLSSDNRVGITNYNPVSSIEDYGVDATGIDINQLPTTIQVKFRSNPLEKLTIKDLHNFHGISYKEYGVPVQNGRIILFTNCGGLHWNTETNVLRNCTITYASYNENNRSNYNLRNLIDNNTSFWINLNKMISYNIDMLLN